jgi:hypothetical protein
LIDPSINKKLTIVDCDMAERCDSPSALFTRRMAERGKDLAFLSIGGIAGAAQVTANPTKCHESFKLREGFLDDWKTRFLAEKWR